MYMKSFLLPFLLIGSCLLFGQSNDQKKSVQIQVSINDAPLSASLNWDDAVTPTSDVSIYRREEGSSSWGAPIAMVAPGTQSYTDTDIEAATVYEYRVTRPGADAVGNGYAYTTVDLPAPVERGVLILVVDDALLPQLAFEIDRYRQDVEADGWLVKTLEVPATAIDTTVKNSIRTLYEEAPEQRHALFLLGHVPVPYSGNIYPDGHDNHIGAWSSGVLR